MLSYKAMVFWFCVYWNRRWNQCIAAQKIKNKLPFLFIYLPPTQFCVTQQLIVPQKWQTTFLEAHEVQITKMLFPNFCLNSIQYFIADNEILSSRSLNSFLFLFWPTACSLRSPWGIKEIVLFDFFLYFPDRLTAQNSLVKVLINTESKNHGLIIITKARHIRPWLKIWWESELLQRYKNVTYEHLTEHQQRIPWKYRFHKFISTPRGLTTFQKFNHLLCWWFLE